jgi:hypothetical protein
MAERTVRKLRGSEYPVTEETYAQVAWLLKKYSSYTYCERMRRIYASFLAGYKAHAKTEPWVEWYMETLARLFHYQALLEEGLSLLRAGDRSGYRQILLGLDFTEYLGGRRFSEAGGLDEIGMRRLPQRHTGLYAWAWAAMLMAERVLRTLSVQWTFERILGIEWSLSHEMYFADFGRSLRPSTIPPLVRHPRTVFLRPKTEIPLTGIWQPISIDKGCLNFLRQGLEAPPILVPIERTDKPPWPGGDGNPPFPAVTYFDYQAKPTEWHLVWEDRRYLDGLIPPEEIEYLQDPYAEFPNDAVTPVPALR